MSHMGLDCALPSHQVLSAAAAAAPGGVPEARLWAPSSEDSDYRLLEVQTSAGPRCLRCGGVKLGKLAREALWPLPPLLRDILGLPHVVGLAEVDGRVVWLVDLKRFRPETELETVFGRLPNIGNPPQ